MDQFFGMKVLIVDDEDDIRRIIRTSLEDLGADFVEAPNGLEALNILHKQHVDLMVTDIKMPVMDGMTLLREVHLRHPDLISMVLTGYGEKDFILEALKLHVFDFLEKPFTKEVLLNRVSNGLRYKRQRQYLDLAVKEFVCSYSKVASRDDFDKMSMEQKAKTIEAGLGLLKLINLKKA